MKKIMTLLVCLSLVMALLAGCGSGTEVEYYDSAEQETPLDENAAPADDEIPVDPDAEEAQSGISIMKGGTGYQTYSPDTVAGVIAGSDVSWMEYFYWLNYYANYYAQLAQSYGVKLTSWDAVGELSSEKANGDALIEMTKFTISQYHAVLAETERAGVSLSEEDQAELDDMYISNCDTDGDGVASDEELAAFEDYLAEQNVDKDFFMYLNEVALLSDKLFEANYGVNGESCPDDITMQYINDSGAMNAKHILLLTVDSVTREALDEDTIAQKLDTAKALQAELAAIQENKEALISMFDEYMAQYTEDTGYAANPDGYVFVPGEMVQEFEDAVLDLDDNYGLSEVVESPYGYHIILRQPLTPDTVIGTNNNGVEVTFRFAAAEQQFSAMLGALTDSAEAVWNEGFEAPDMQAIFG